MLTHESNFIACINQREISASPNVIYLYVYTVYIHGTVPYTVYILCIYIYDTIDVWLLDRYTVNYRKNIIVYYSNYYTILSFTILEAEVECWSTDQRVTGSNTRP